MIVGVKWIHALYKLMWFLLMLHFCNIKGNVKGYIIHLNGQN